MGKKEILLIVAIVLTVLAGIAAIIYLGIMGFFTGNLFESGTQSGAGGRGSCSILYPASAGSYDQIGAAIDAWIKQNGPGSPLEGKGFLIAKSGAESGVNPALIAAIARKESSFGKNIPDDTYNPFGRTASESQPGVTIGTHKWYKYSSWDEAIAEEGPFIKRRYIDEGLVTIGAFVETYCPRIDCDTDTYITQMTDWMNEITRLAGGALGEECNEAVIAGEGEDHGQCLDSREVAKPPGGPALLDNGGRYAQVTLADKLEGLYKLNSNWSMTEACPPTYLGHKDKNHYNGRAVDIVITGIAPNSSNIDKLLSDINTIGFDDVIDEYRHPTSTSTGGHIHLEWHSQ